MTYVVNRRKANKRKMLEDCEVELEALERDIKDLQRLRRRLQRFTKTLAGVNGVERAGKMYTENEEAIYEVLPYSVARIYNPNVN